MDSSSGTATTSALDVVTRLPTVKEVVNAAAAHWAGVKSRFGDGKYADLTIAAGERKWKVHKCIVCSGCEFFARACDGGFLESSTNVIRLPDDDPDAVNQLLQFLYTGKFNLKPTNFYYVNYREQIRLINAVFHLAGKYLLPQLQDLAVKKFAYEIWMAECDGESDEVLPRLINAVDDVTDADPNALQALLIEVLVQRFQELYGNPDHYDGLHKALARRPMLAYKVATTYAVKRVETMTRFFCTAQSCVHFHAEIEMPKGVAPPVHCPAKACKGEIQQSESWAEEIRKVMRDDELDD